MEKLNDQQLFEAWKKSPEDQSINGEIERRKFAQSGSKCSECGGTEVWTGPVTSCGCIDWND